ncbi:MAG: hypothetical protein A3A80_00410 [Candidatus Terrybacteria bacterium RIFCSPLOWO2_01_FULL_44_24]|uniref:Uncharacterized protein n=1 Tax=Candidatus Terrybacteria bacterium RIFCSPHIGHO2_01_FULL_43_35 TaxID=1802361 RepID=A0A1G2PDZ6_9BACT|nr:MAG: hypothetical protein A2828_00860 [Candidatus Terrybacteria bacterium RIFCSPHIGHO2_01_FULL_43_35]OHA51964.1 MAG: hypothetical protein A3A80_00410 [Candidatus Terrybacteria bacterium RIFCSPLOWO2_01_FULL_44_24]
MMPEGSRRLLRAVAVFVFMLMFFIGWVMTINISSPGSKDDQSGGADTKENMQSLPNLKDIFNSSIDRFNSENPQYNDLQSQIFNMEQQNNAASEPAQDVVPNTTQGQEQNDAIQPDVQNAPVASGGN